MKAQKYSCAREIYPLNEAIQAVPSERAHMNKLWYVESPECLPGLCPAEGMANTTANTRRDQKTGRGAESKAEELSAGKEGAELPTVRKPSRSAKRCKRTIRVAAFRLLVTNPRFVPISVEQWGDKFVLQSSWKGERFQFSIKNYLPQWSTYRYQ